MEEVLQLCHELCSICAGILFRCGPFMKETIYQDLLIHELGKLGIETTRELVFNYCFKDSGGTPHTICNNQFLRTDVEIPLHRCILELKSTTAPTKDDQLWQLRNYLENRDDRDWGIVINFISKFGPKTSPKVQCDLLYKTNEYHQTTTSGQMIRKYNITTIYSESYPMKDDVFQEVSSNLFVEKMESS